MSYICIRESFKTGLKQFKIGVSNTFNRDKSHGSKLDYFKEYYDLEKAKPELKKLIQKYNSQYSSHYTNKKFLDQTYHLRYRDHKPDEYDKEDDEEFAKQDANTQKFRDTVADENKNKMGTMTVGISIDGAPLAITFDDKSVKSCKLKIINHKLKPGEQYKSLVENIELPGAKEILMKYKKK